MSNHDHTFQGRKKKLSGWVRRMIQPTRDVSTRNHLVSDEEETDLPRSTASKSPNDDDGVSMKVLWDSNPVRAKSEPRSIERDSEQEPVDNVSITPLFSMCSSSVKSSTFSDSYSIQSTRATVVSGRTVETNSSTMAIPPASIMDRTRASSINAPASSNSSVGPTTPTSVAQPYHSHHRHYQGTGSRPSSMRHLQIQRDPSSDTINSSSTIK
ncbi:hypothetical protein HG537_0A07990 [Torulaspora globosa]|uniref:Uncharacterized protein n=1 Tax=Torulaspora globosa TaxID=48254 RepID=A0A7H9HQE9_9SACH|nr:hypothetical protein HG537_0A07990 [Torulaspora sp. CBS 2947]